MKATLCCTRLLQQQIQLYSVTNMMQCAVCVTMRLEVYDPSSCLLTFREASVISKQKLQTLLNNLLTRCQAYERGEGHFQHKM
jgi:hypothetical protein